jgi:hypothetical protein
MFCPQCQTEYGDGATECFYCHIPLPGGGLQLYNLDELRRTVAALEKLTNAVGTVNVRPPGWHNDLFQLAKKLLVRLLIWYTRPLREFNGAVSRSLEEILSSLEHLYRSIVALDHLSTNMLSLEGRLAQSEMRTTARLESMQNQLELLREQAQASVSEQMTSNPDTPAGSMETKWDKRVRENPRFHIDTVEGHDRTAYIIGLFGTGRSYLTELMLYNIGERAKYVRDTIRLHPGPTPMIYSGHATMKYLSRAQYSPAVMSCILEAVKLGFADLIFLYRHPLDSLLTNWIWWRTYIRESTMIKGISQAYKSRDDLCTDLEQNFLEFKSFAEGDPDFYSCLQGPRFLSFPEFVEETELHLQAATLALRLEDFAIDPFREFSKIVEVILGDRDFSPVSLAPPRTKAYGYLAVKEKVPRFRSFIDGLDVETKRRIEKIGYTVNGPS